MKKENVNHPIHKGSIVKYLDGYYRVRAMFKETVNLCSIFSGKIYHKRVPLSEVVEAYEEWYSFWSKSETYMSM